MRTISICATTLAATLSFAHADVSEDIVFCSKIKSERERIACYDAAARVAAKAGPSRRAEVRKPEQLVSRPVVMPPQYEDTALSSPSFSGAYALIYGGAFRSPRNFNSDGFSHIHGATAGIGAGYNFKVARFILGVEGRTHYDFGKDDLISGFQSRPFPNFAPPLPVTPVVGSFRVAETTYKRTWGADISWRGGVLLSDWLIAYGRIGVGVQEFRLDRLTTDGDLICFNPTTISNGSIVTVTGCDPLERRVTSRRGQSDIWYNPYLLLGTGIEANFSNYFVRAEAEFASYLSHRTNLDTGLYAMYLSVGVGVRF